MQQEIIIRPERRLCTVNGEIGYFHCWENYMTVIDASPLQGGHPGGQISEFYAIVEFEDRVAQVPVHQIRFGDEENSMLSILNRHHEEKENKK